MNHIKQTYFFKLFILLIFTFILNNVVLSQVKNEEVTVIAVYEPSLSDAHKININPEIDEKAIDKPQLKYAITPQLLNTTFEPTKITAARISGEPLSKLYSSYIKAGFGNYMTPYAEIFYNKLRSRTSNLGINYKHYSSSGKIIDYGPAGFSDNNLNAYGSYFSENHIFTGDFLYKRNAFHYYGFKPIYDFNLPINDSLKDLTFQKYQTLEASAAIKSNYTDKEKLQYGTDLKFYNLKNALVVENGLVVKAYLKKNVDLLSQIDDEKLSLEAGVNYYNNPEFAVKDAADVTIRPLISFQMNQYALTVGINTNIEAGVDSYIHFYPVIEGRIAIAKDVLSLYGSLTGNTERNNVRTLFEENPFIVDNFDSLEFTTNKVLFKGGFKGNIASVFNFNIGAGFKEIENMPFFVNDTIGFFNKFNLVYDDVTILNAFAEFSYQTSEKLLLMLRGEFNHYTMGVEKEAWHKPRLNASFIASYRLVDKINIKAELYAQDNTYAKLYDEKRNVIAQKIDGFADFNLAFEYLYNKKISAFLNLNNISGTRYYRWYNYPTQRFQVLGGLTYAF